MIRVPHFRYYAATSAVDAAKALADEGPKAALLAGGTDLIPAMKRRQLTPRVVVSLRRSSELRGIESNGELTIGAMTTLREIAGHPCVRQNHRALLAAASRIATPLIRNTATIGGNLALDTRCTYFDQSEEWRRAIGYCLKNRGGEDAAVCWVAPSSARCWAVSSGDTIPALIALGARVTLVSREGERDLALEDLYRDDGIEPLAKRHDEIVTSIRIRPDTGRSTYWKLSRRGSFDFPDLGVAASIRLTAAGTVEAARVVLGAVASGPLLLTETDSLLGRVLTDDVVAAFAERAAARARPLDNTDFSMTWRKTVVTTFLTGVLRELRGDDPAQFPLLMRLNHAAGPQGGYR